MKFLVIATIASASFTPAADNPFMLPGSLKVEQYQPIEIRSSEEIPENYIAYHDWRVERPARGREYEAGKVFAVWGPPGTYEVELEIILINWEERDLRRIERITTLHITKRDDDDDDDDDEDDDDEDDDEEDDDDDDEPDIPDDDFDSIGRKVYAWGLELLGDEARSFAPRMAETYKQASEKLTSGDLTSINAAARWVTDQNQAIQESARDKQQVQDDYNRWAGRIAPVWTANWPMSREQVAAFYTAIHEGLKHVR